MKQTKLLIILDGWGHSENSENNAIALANTPIWDSLISQYPNTLIGTSGASVGLPDGQMGNSEVGHLTIGSGRIIEQNFTLIQNDIDSGVFEDNAALCSALNTANDNGKAVHIMGQLSDGGVHSHHAQILAMLEMASQKGCAEIYLHIFTDGRDTPPNSANEFVVDLEEKITELDTGRIASVVGRFYAMDRDNRWNRVEKAYNLLVNGKGEYSATSAAEAVEAAYERGENDEFIKPTTIGEAVTINEDDAVIFMNFRADRARELTRAITDANFSEFSRETFAPTHYVCLTEYKEAFNLPCAYPPQTINNTLGSYVSDLGMNQLRIAETEKYAHVTFFFNGGVETPLPGEDRTLIQSPDVATYDLQPEMSAPELTEALVSSINSGKYDLIICNYANTDMVGHSGKLSAAISAVEAIDACIGRVYEACQSTGAEMLITADHGNAEQMVNPKTNKMHTAHTNNPVPLLYVGGRDVTLIEPDTGTLAGLAPSLLELMGVEKPGEMTGQCLLTIN
ncbi:MAG: 2,3-bisphosphoglycerate-independent phosphoglycerate mutase [Gammaproteobacteria bacterium]|nr:2,3-bisphosphoglycerate-independent phosphoglycerate mutase [Gammaproteobacteria bacterium]